MGANNHMRLHHNENLRCDELIWRERNIPIAIFSELTSLTIPMAHVESKTGPWAQLQPTLSA